MKPDNGYMDNWELDSCGLPKYGIGKRLLGTFRDHSIFRGMEGWTSEIVSIDYDTGIVETKNSIYHLGTKREEEPSVE